MRRDLGPVEHRGDQRARLRDEGDVAGQRVGVREAGVQARGAASAGPRQFGPEDAQQVRPRGVERGLLLRGVERRPSSRSPRACQARRVRSTRPARWPAACRSRPGRAPAGRSAARAKTGAPSSVRVLRVDGVDRPGEAAGAQVAPDRGADAAGARRRRRTRRPMRGRTACRDGGCSSAGARVRTGGRQALSRPACAAAADTAPGHGNSATRHGSIAERCRHGPMLARPGRPRCRRPAGRPAAAPGCAAGTVAPPAVTA